MSPPCDDRRKDRLTPQPGAIKPTVHLHPEQDEHFEVLAGEITTFGDGEERTYGEAEGFDIPRWTPQTMWIGGHTRA